MYPQSMWQWLAGVAVLAVILGAVGWLFILLDGLYERHIQKHHGAPKDDDGHSRLRLVFEVLSAILVVTSLLVAIYSDSQLLRAVAGIAMIVLVAAATVTVMSPDP